MNPASELVKEGNSADDDFAELMGYVTTYLRGVVSARKDRIINDPFAKPLTRKHQAKLDKFIKNVLQPLYPFLETFIAIRTRYLDEALYHRDPRILQVVNLGAGLDARAYRLDSLRGCKVLEIDQSNGMFEHKAEVMKELHAPLLAQCVDCVVLNLADEGLEANLMGHGFNPTMPTFWIMEGLVPYMEHSSLVKLMKAIDYVSAPGSSFWTDIPGERMIGKHVWGNRAMKYGEDDPLHGVLRETSWTLEEQASLSTVDEHFGRKVSPFLSPESKEPVPISFIIGKKPIPDVVVKQKMMPGLEFED
ncbi:hypothetical protein PsorP6_018708 [Peronosclerospora sorghi]|nr:hypothetical protein PsorP6_018726 [Peronosclerospora sorghi]KAI9895404.1 hypothetical protein PsorP6_018708 [Peronosclerospora sorghi]